MTHLTSHELLAKLADSECAAACYALVMAEPNDSEQVALQHSEVADCVQGMNRRLHRARSRFIGRTADQVGLGALSPQERAEMLRPTRREDEKNR